ncbi:MAG: PEP-utilizing enzyme [Trichococcus flocculiformis]
MLKDSLLISVDAQSHSAIMARSLEIPAIVGSKEITQIVKDGDIMHFGWFGRRRLSSILMKNTLAAVQEES